MPSAEWPFNAPVLLALIVFVVALRFPFVLRSEINWTTATS
jgi:hypothetical protein